MSDSYYSPGKFSILPLITKNLLIINTLCYFAMVVFKMTFGLDLNDICGLHYFQSSKFHFYQFLTYMFMHGSFEHLFFNMFALWMFGSVIENYWGSKKYLIYYLITGIGAAMTHYLIVGIQMSSDVSLIKACIQVPNIENLENLIGNHRFMLNENAGDIWSQFIVFQQNVHALSFNPQNISAAEGINRFLNNYLDYYASLPNIVGASGSIYGLLLVFGMLFPNSMIYLYFFIPMKAKWFVIIFGVVELLSGIFGTADGVAHFAHLGGMVFGIILILLWRKRDRYYNDYDY